MSRRVRLLFRFLLDWWSPPEVPGGTGGAIG
jgi:hypothetical protein